MGNFQSRLEKEMTRKDYIAIAEIFRKELEKVNGFKYPEGRTDSIIVAGRLACLLADLFESENKAFNRTKFYTACGLDPLTHIFPAI